MGAGAVGDVPREGVAGVGGVVGEVGVQVDGHPEPLGQREHAVDVVAALLGRRLHVAAAADDVGTGAQALDEQVLGARALEDALLRERDDLQVDEVGVRLPEPEQHLETEQPDDGVDVGVGPDRGRPVDDGLFEDLGGSRADPLGL